MEVLSALFHPDNLKVKVNQNKRKVAVTSPQNQVKVKVSKLKEIDGGGAVVSPQDQLLAASWQPFLRLRGDPTLILSPGQLNQNISYCVISVICITVSP